MIQWVVWLIHFTDSHSKLLIYMNYDLISKYESDLKGKLIVFAHPVEKESCLSCSFSHNIDSVQ